MPTPAASQLTDEDTDPASVLHQCVAWLSKSDGPDRTRIVGALAVYFNVPGAAQLLTQSCLADTTAAA